MKKDMETNPLTFDSNLFENLEIHRLGDRVKFKTLLSTLSLSYTHTHSNLSLFSFLSLSLSDTLNTEENTQEILRQEAGKKKSLKIIISLLFNHLKLLLS